MEKIEGVHRTKITSQIRPILNRPIDAIRAVLKDNKQIKSYVVGIPAQMIEINCRDDGRFDIIVTTE